MARHINTTQVIDHFKKAHAASVDGSIYKKIIADDTNLTIGPVVFPLDFFDIGGVNPHTFILMDSDHKYHDIMLLKQDGYKMDHPDWDTEEYNGEKVRNHRLVSPK